MTRDEAFEAFLAAVVAAVPEDEHSSEWTVRRAILRETAVEYCRVAVDEALSRALAHVLPQ